MCIHHPTNTPTLEQSLFLNYKGSIKMFSGNPEIEIDYSIKNRNTYLRLIELNAQQPEIMRREAITDVFNTTLTICPTCWPLSLLSRRR